MKPIKRSNFDLVDAIRASTEAGDTIEQTADKVGLHPGTVWEALTQDVSLSDLDPRPWVHLDRQRVATALQWSLSTKDLADMLNMSLMEVRKHRICINAEEARAEKNNQPITRSKKQKENVA